MESIYVCVDKNWKLVVPLRLRLCIVGSTLVSRCRDLLFLRCIETFMKAISIRVVYNDKNQILLKKSHSNTIWERCGHGDGYWFLEGVFFKVVGVF